MDVGMLIDSFLKYALLPLASIVSAIVWHMYNKHDVRLENLEKRIAETEKLGVEMKTGFVYVSRDIEEIKKMLTYISGHIGGRNGRRDEI